VEDSRHVKARENRVVKFTADCVTATIIMAYKDEAERMIQGDTADDVPLDAGPVDDLDKQYTGQ
jgi:hypothetical protein